MTESTLTDAINRMVKPFPREDQRESEGKRWRIFCGQCGKGVTHLVEDERYGGCPWCKSFKTTLK